MSLRTPLKIGNAQGFWGDRSGQAARLIAQQPDLDFITMDYLAEVSLSLLSMQKIKDSEKGYAGDFLEELRRLAPFWKQGGRFKVVVNAGGLNPIGCARACQKLLANEGLSHLKVGCVYGDDVLDMIKKGGSFSYLDTGAPIESVRERLVSANAYLGAQPLVDVLKMGADVVITGRVADPSLTVACCVYHYGWNEKEFDRLAGATVAGHLIECGAQVTGGIATNWLELPHMENVGYPFVEMEQDGTFVITKPEGTGGRVDECTVKEQLLYEIGDPDNYLSPDVTVSFLGLHLEQQGKDRVRLSGARGRAASGSYKVSACYHSGFIAEAMLVLVGSQVQEKVRRCGEIVFARVKEQGFELQGYHVECLGGTTGQECVMRFCASDTRKEALECFAKELAPLITTGPQGITGYASGRPKVKMRFGFWPTLIDRAKVYPEVHLL